MDFYDKIRNVMVQFEIRCPKICSASCVSAGCSSSIGCASASYADNRRFDPHFQQNVLSLRFGHEKNSTAILSHLLIQEGQLSVTGERMDTKYW